MTRYATLLIPLVGFASIVAGVALVYVPAAFIVAGIGLLVYGLLREVPDPARDGDDVDGGERS